MADEGPDDDIIEQGGRGLRLPNWRPARGVGVIAVAALAVGLATGYAAGSQHGRRSAGRPQPPVTGTASPSAPVPASSFPFAGSPALTQDTSACSVQAGNDLELGIQLTNQSTQPLGLTTAKAVLPLGGLKQLTWQWGTCGALPAGSGQGTVLAMLMPGRSTWLTATFKVQLRCPGPLPVQFSVGYQVNGHAFTVSLPGFADLSRVPYSGCPASSAGANFSAVQVQATP